MSAPASVIHAGYRLPPLRLVEEHTIPGAICGKSEPTDTARHCNRMQHAIQKAIRFKGKQNASIVIHGHEHHTAKHCNTPQWPQHTATNCNILQHTILEANRVKSEPNASIVIYGHKHHTTTHHNTSQHTATRCNTPHHTAIHCNTLQYTAIHCNTPSQRQSESRASRMPLSLSMGTDITPQHTAAHRSTPQPTATHCNILQHIATRRNTMQHTTTATLSYTPSQRQPESRASQIPPLLSMGTNIALQHAATRRNTLQHTATPCNTLQHTIPEAIRVKSEPNACIVIHGREYQAPISQMYLVRVIYALCAFFFWVGGWEILTTSVRCIGYGWHAPSFFVFNEMKDSMIPDVNRSIIWKVCVCSRIQQEGCGGNGMLCKCCSNVISKMTIYWRWTLYIAILFTQFVPLRITICRSKTVCKKMTIYRKGDVV